MLKGKERKGSNRKGERLPVKARRNHGTQPVRRDAIRSLISGKWKGIAKNRTRQCMHIGIEIAINSGVA